jgi:glucose-6-phosphate dehydrogenase assembly protein OpcA
MSKGPETPVAEEFLSGKLAQVNVARIEKELASLWKQAAQDDVNSGAGTVVRACSLNLVLLTDDEEAETKCSDLLDEIEQANPCRSILAIFRPTKSHNLNAWVSARCHLMGSSKQICSEQITVCCDGGRPEELGSVVLPLVLPDLPVFIWWRKRGLNWQEFQTLQTSADRLIIDSGFAPFEVELLQEAQQVIKDSGHGLQVSDLNWRRLQGWCRAVADAFDGFPLDAAYLNKISRISFSFVGTEKDLVSNRVLLLTAWLATRLGWQPVELDLKSGARFKGPSGDLEILFKPDSSDTNPGHLREVQVEFAGSPEKLLISPERTAEARFIIARLDGSDENEATRISNVLSETVLLGQELQVLTGDPIYEASIAMVSKMLSVRKK